MWFKALLAAAPAALFLTVPTPLAHADGACTALGSDYEAYMACTQKTNVPCTGSPRGMLLGANLTCTYPDDGRDECVVQFAYMGHGRVADFSCTYVPPGSESAPASEPS